MTASPFLVYDSKFRLERVTPVEHYINPIAANADPAISSRAGCLTTLAKLIARLVGTISQIRSVVLQPVDTHAHTWRDEIPKVPLTKQDAIAMELVNQRGRGTTALGYTGTS